MLVIRSRLLKAQRRFTDDRLSLQYTATSLRPPLSPPRPLQLELATKVLRLAISAKLQLL